MCHSLRIRWSVAGWCGWEVLAHDSIKIVTTFSSLSMCWVSTHEPYRWKKWKWDGYSDRKDNSRWWKMFFRKICKPIWEKNFQCKRVKTLEKTQHKSLFNTFHNESICHWTIQSYWKTICRNNLSTMEIINESTCFHISCLSTTRESIELSVCDPSM